MSATLHDYVYDSSDEGFKPKHELLPWPWRRTWDWKGFQAISLPFQSGELVQLTVDLKVEASHNCGSLFLTKNICYSNVDDVIGLAMDKVTLLNLWNQKSILQRDSWLGADERLAKPSLWASTSSLSINDVERHSIPETTDNEEKLRIIHGLNSSRLRTDGLFFQFKKDPKLVLYPDIQLASKGRDQDLDIWGDGAKQWILTQVGQSDAFVFLIAALSSVKQR